MITLLPLAVTTVVLALLSSIPFERWVLVPILAAMAGFIFVQVLHTRQLAKSFWLSTYLRPDSPIHKLVNRSYFLWVLSALITIPLTFVTYVALYGYGFWECFAIGIALLGAKSFQACALSPIDSNVASHLVELAKVRVFFWIAILLILSGLATTSIIKGFGSDYSKTTADEMATTVIKEIKHPVRVVRHCTRVMRFSELQLLRIRDILGWPYGWCIYLFFLIPNAVPALGLVSLFAGLDRVIHLRAP